MNVEIQIDENQIGAFYLKHNHLQFCLTNLMCGGDPCRYIWTVYVVRLFPSFEVVAYKMFETYHQSMEYVERLRTYEAYA